MTEYKFRFRFRKYLPDGAIRNDNYPEHRLAGLFLNSLVKGRNEYTGPSQFNTLLSSFPAVIEIAKEVGYKMDSPRERPHILGVKRRGKEYIVGCGSLVYGTLERYDPSSLDDLAKTPKPIN